MGNTGLSHGAAGSTGTIVASPALAVPIALATKEVPWIKLRTVYVIPNDNNINF